MEPLPLGRQVIGAVQRAAQDSDIWSVPRAACPGELHKHWRAEPPGGYHLEYGFSCMGYEIAGALGVKLAHPEREVIVMVGDGSYLMLNSEIATSVRLGARLIVVLLDNGGFGCIERLQSSTGNASFNNLRDRRARPATGSISSRTRAASSAHASRVKTVAQLAGALAAARQSRSHFGAGHRDRPGGEHHGRRSLVGCGGARGVRSRRSPQRLASATIAHADRGRRMSEP